MIPPSHISSRALTKSREQTFLRVLTLNLYTHVSSVSRLCKKKKRKEKKKANIPWKSPVARFGASAKKKSAHYLLSTKRPQNVSCFDPFVFFFFWFSESSTHPHPSVLNRWPWMFCLVVEIILEMWGKKRRQSLQKYCVTIRMTIILFSSDG